VGNIDVCLSIDSTIVERPDLVLWNSYGDLNMNRSEVARLPNNLISLVVGTRILQIGKAADAFWLYENAGIYGSASEVPTSGGNVFNFDGIPFQYGDPKWVDQNNDFQITEA